MTREIEKVIKQAEEITDMVIKRRKKPKPKFQFDDINFHKLFNKSDKAKEI